MFRKSFAIAALAVIEAEAHTNMRDLRLAQEFSPNGSKSRFNFEEFG